ncbi:MAG: hypothetical protein H7A21_08425 [Spirochaetales bacterium]|nr:hypothetical protein [Leptospiraceae bacterium]MCP5481441.1 hypothetical protein [Spirochaetales bacterium]MCP5486015.1 hypothetical protein [Spirochaetales bacterium]
MAITNRGSGWEWAQSWWLLLPLGWLTACLGFIYAGLRAGRFKWTLTGLIYGAVTVGCFYFFLQQPEPAVGSEAQTDPVALIVGLIFFGMWPVGVIHALLIRKEFLLHMDARSKVDERELDRRRTEVAAEYKVSDNRIDEALVYFKDDDFTVRMMSTLFSVLPFAPDFRTYYNVEGAVKRLQPDASEAAIAKAQQLALEDDVVSALKVGRALDTADTGLGIVTGARNIYSHVKDTPGRRTFEADPQQAADAAIKALAMAYMVAKLFDGGITDKVRQFFELKAGKEMALYFASAEVALPFTDNLLEAGGNWMNSLLESAGKDSQKRFEGFAGGGALGQAKQILEQLQTQMDGFLAQVKMYADPLLEKAKSIAPTVLNAADSISGGVATAVDFMPAWRYLSARLAAESVASRALKGPQS